ncbi:MAG TPA: zinc-binding alcohol dehydrogenase family protein [Sedimenticola sp.]|nr:zinc-binding alcohol dehydrogenase family protein [Sedimenticola sp.]
MRAIGFTGGRPLEDPDAFVAFEQETPVPQGRDLLIRVEAAAANPVDYKVREGITEPQEPPRILGWDAAGVVEAVGDQVQLFKPGARVFYAGDVTRPGSNATHQLVDERIVGQAPKNLGFAEAAALPLTAITAWEALFERLKIDPEADAGKRVLIIGGAGGVGSIAIQLARKVAKLEIVATASREESRAWCTELGADHTIDHSEDMAAQIKQKGIGLPDYILCLSHTDQHFLGMVNLIAPQGMICGIVGTKQKHDLDLLKSKSAGFVWEFMFTRSMYRTEDMIEQHRLLNEIARLVEEGEIRTTLRQNLGPLSVASVRKAHGLLEQGHGVGKMVFEGFE